MTRREAAAFWWFVGFISAILVVHLVHWLATAGLEWWP